MDIPGSLPIEIFHEILKYLSSRDLYNARNCCKKWRYMMESFWKLKCKMECYFETEDDLNSKFYHECMKQFSRWEGIYLYNSKLEENWIDQNYKEVVNDVDKLTGFSIQYFSGDVIIATSGCHQILVINSTTAMIEKRFCVTVPEGIVIRCIRAVRKVANKLIVVIGTETINDHCYFNYPEILFVKVWNIETKASLLSTQMEIVEDHIDKVIIHKDLITVLSNSHSVYVYNIKTNNVDYRRRSVSCIWFDNDKVAMGSLVGTVVILNLDFIELMTLRCCDTERTIITVQMEGNFLVTLCGSSAKLGVVASVWNIKRSFKLLYKIEKVFRKCFSMYVHENKLGYVCADECKQEKLIFKLCNLDTGDCILNLEVPGYVTTHNSFIINRSVDNPFLLKLWSIKTGKLIARLRLAKPFSFEFFENDLTNRRTKSKFVYLRYDCVTTKWSLNIMDFEANMKFE